MDYFSPGLSIHFNRHHSQRPEFSNLESAEAARVAVIGGAPLDGQRFV